MRLDPRHQQWWQEAVKEARREDEHFWPVEVGSSTVCALDDYVRYLEGVEAAARRCQLSLDASGQPDPALCRELWQQLGRPIDERSGSGWQELAWQQLQRVSLEELGAQWSVYEEERGELVLSRSWPDEARPEVDVEVRLVPHQLGAKLAVHPVAGLDKSRRRQLYRWLAQGMGGHIENAEAFRRLCKRLRKGPVDEGDCSA